MHGPQSKESFLSEFSVSATSLAKANVLVIVVRMTNTTMFRTSRGECGSHRAPGRAPGLLRRSLSLAPDLAPVRPSSPRRLRDLALRLAPELSLSYPRPLRGLVLDHALELRLSQHVDLVLHQIRARRLLPPFKLPPCCLPSLAPPCPFPFRLSLPRQLLLPAGRGVACPPAMCLVSHPALMFPALVCRMQACLKILGSLSIVRLPLSSATTQSQ